MEQILVALDLKYCGQEAIWRGMALARRIGAKLHVLVFLPPRNQKKKSHDHRPPDLPEPMRNRLDIVRKWAQDEGVQVSFYVTEGIFEDEVVRFASQKKITLFVAEARGNESNSSEQDRVIEAIRHRISCRLEIVSPKKL